MLIKTNVHPTKNPLWEHWTPNECWEDEDFSQKHLGLSYSKLTDEFCTKYNVNSKRLWREVRVKNIAPSIARAGKESWWDQPELAERIFWVFHSPTYSDIDGTRYFYYILEPFECLRVVQVGIDKLGYNPFTEEIPALYLPVECATAAWDETSGGYSDHLRHRPEAVLTQQEIDEEEKTNELAKVIEKEIGEISEEQYGPIVPGKRI